MKHALVTGATGFVGFHLVKHLSENGFKVSCLVRRESKRERLDPFAPDYLIGDVTDRASIDRAVSGAPFDVVFHLAGLTKSINADTIMHVNEGGTRNVAAVCADQATPPVLVIMSSLAALGPDPVAPMDREASDPCPVSSYGRSKRAGEQVAQEYASRVPISIVRPPIVLGEGDSDGLTMYETIANLGLHLVPGIRDHQYSVVYAGDVARACALIAGKGTRVIADDDGQSGRYFVADDQTFTYAELGRAIGEALGRKRTFMIRFPVPFVWLIAAGGELFGRIRRKPSLLNLDKAREATAGSWTCSAERLKHDTGFSTTTPIAERLSATVQWYKQEGWLR